MITGTVRRTVPQHDLPIDLKVFRLLQYALDKGGVTLGSCFIGRTRGIRSRIIEEIVIVEDVITAGTAIRESMAILSSLKDTKVAACFVMVDRKEKGQTEKGAMQEIEEQFGFPVYSVVDVYDIIEYLEEDPANEENVTRIKNYLAVNGAK